MAADRTLGVLFAPETFNLGAQQSYRAACPVGGSNAASAILTFIRGDAGR